MSDQHTTAHHLLDVLREFGVDTVFGIPGGAISKLYSVLPERRDLRVVTAKHETGAAFMAMGYTLATGRPGVVLTTAGPGITNALTGIASAFYEGLPVVYIAGEVARAAFGRGALQEGSPAGFDAVSLLRRVTKMSTMLTHPGPAAAVLRKALLTAYSGRRGPVFLSLPLDVSNAHVAPQPITGSVRSSFEVDSESARQALELLENAKRPLILAGSGVRDATARRALRRLAEHVRAPVCVTTKAKGVFPEDHPLYLGITGFGGHESVIEYLEREVDVLLAVGTGLNDFTTNAWSPKFRASRAFIQIDIDSAQLGKNYPIDMGVVGPADAVIGRMLEHRDEGRFPKSDIPPRLKLQARPESKSGQLTTADVMLVMNDVLPANAFVTSDMGEHLAFALHYYRARAAGDFFTALGFGSMGSGIVSAIGWQLGCPDRRTFAICGDGGMQMFGSEVATAVQWRAATTFVVINDARLNMVHHGLRDQYGQAPDLQTPMVDFAGWARSIGAIGRTVTSSDELAEGLGIDEGVPVVLDVRVDPEVRLGGSQRVAALRQFATQG